MTSTDFTKFLVGTSWEDASETCQEWMAFRNEIENAASMIDRPAPLSGKSLLRYLALAEASNPAFRENLHLHGFSYYKLFTLPQVTQDQKEKLHQTKQFKRVIGELICQLYQVCMTDLHDRELWVKHFNESGEGASGVCILVYDRIRKIHQVMKIQHLKNQRAVRDFKKEVKMMTRLSSPNVVRIEEGGLDFNKSDHRVCLE